MSGASASAAPRKPGGPVRDNDRAYGHVFTSRVNAMGIRDHPTSPGLPWQNGYAERLIGTLRCECLDRMLIFGESHLQQVLASYAAYYNQTRTHLAFQKDAPSIEQSNGPVSLSPSPSWRGCIADAGRAAAGGG
jgi:transposase InsO family protein